MDRLLVKTDCVQLAVGDKKLRAGGIRAGLGGRSASRGPNCWPAGHPGSAGKCFVTGGRVDAGAVVEALGSTEGADLGQYAVDCDAQINPVDSGIVHSLLGTCNAPRDACP